MTRWEDRFEKAFLDPATRARVLQVFYWISLSFTLLGFAVILWTLRREGAF